MKVYNIPLYRRPAAPQGAVIHEKVVVCALSEAFARAAVEAHEFYDVGAPILVCAIDVMVTKTS